ncbi:hypothetical protein [Pseudomonas brassicacearum]|uniref:Uncharacterized protein n=1 Tax=Pseudomonas brassicacearum TaxID=930166 RepID=A0A423H217_9PSED|nr:hypothetical protein [Pseudomonas brassicacearum]RON06233.1 hypothetical protein BK658_00130 [Pseudomonas brassicacearum]
MQNFDKTKPVLADGLSNNSTLASASVSKSECSNMSNCACTVATPQPLLDNLNDFDFLNSMIALFRFGDALAPSGIDVCAYSGPDGSSVEVRGHAAPEDLRGLRQVGRFDEPPTLGWRDQYNRLYELPDLHHLAGLAAGDLA